MQCERFHIAGPALIRPRVHNDERGFFMESFRDDWFRAEIADVAFIQDNHSLSRPIGTIRGLHYQAAPHAQGKLVRCLKGAIFDVAVDIRLGSATFSHWIAATLTAVQAEQLWIPEGFAHGFCTLLPDTEVFYKVTTVYDPESERGIAYDDPDIAIDWPIAADAAVLSEKDRRQPCLYSLMAQQ